jgi:hypothetical protein
MTRFGHLVASRWRPVRDGGAVPDGTRRACRRRRRVADVHRDLPSAGASANATASIAAAGGTTLYSYPQIGVVMPILKLELPYRPVEERRGPRRGRDGRIRDTRE